MANNPTDKVKKAVKADYIDDDEYNKQKLLLGLGCTLVAIGAPLLGMSAKQVDKARKQRKP